MFIVLLRFSRNKEQASRYMNGHMTWIKRGFDDGVFLVVGSIRPSSGGCLLAHNTSLSELRDRVNDDPFVAEDVASAEIIEIAPSRVDERLAYLLGTTN